MSYYENYDEARYFSSKNSHTSLSPCGASDRIAHVIHANRFGVLPGVVDRMYGEAERGEKPESEEERGYPWRGEYL